MSISDLDSPAEYSSQFSTIRISPTSLARGAITDFLRHEMAHAWDNIRTGKVSKNLRNLKDDALVDELNRRAKEDAPFESQSGKKLLPGHLSMQEMLERYVKVLPDKTKSFAHPSTAGVFHGFNTACQGRMMWLAAALYNFLDQESKSHGLPSPDKEALKKDLDANEPGWRRSQPQDTPSCSCLPNKKGRLKLGLSPGKVLPLNMSPIGRLM